jgi:hypothetical protein
MHWKAYNRLEAADEQAAQRWDAMFIEFAAKLYRPKR